MIYIAELTSKQYGNVCIQHGSREQMLEAARVNSDLFDTEIRLAKRADIQMLLNDLREREKVTTEAYENSGWGMGPIYRDKLQKIRSEIRVLRSVMGEGNKLSEDVN